MAQRVVDPHKLLMMGAVVDWATVFRRQPQTAAQPASLAKARKLGGARIVQLRWLTAESIGLPTEPFKVWRRPSLPFESEKGIEAQTVDFLGMRLVVLPQSMLSLRFTFSCPAANGLVMAYSGAPLSSTLVGSFLRPAAGNSNVRFAGPRISCLLMSSGCSISNLVGLASGAQDDGRWQLVEVVGLPVDSRFAGVFSLDAPQGPTGALRSPRDAALDRFRRGAPFYGWLPEPAPGITAPTWMLADPQAILKLIEAKVLGPLHQMVTTLRPVQHAAFQINHTLPSSTPGGEPVTAEQRPLATLLFGAGTDPLASLVTGYGTAFEDEDIPGINLGAISLFNDPSRSDWDYMVTARWEKGLDHASAPLDLAAIVLAPALAQEPPAPTNLLSASDGLRAPATTDAPWMPVIRATWDKPSDALAVRVASYAYLRAGMVPATGVVPLMDRRPNDNALQPISASGYTDAPEVQRLAALDDRYALDSSAMPNVLNHAVAHQDLIGLWSAWSVVPLSIIEPPPKRVTIVSARLEVTAAAIGLCAAELLVEFSWDWAARSPARFEFVGRLYAQSRLGDGPANLSVPAGLATTLAGAPAPLVRVQHGGAAVGTPSSGVASIGTSLSYVSFDGQTLQVAPPTPAGPRRYRLRITGLRLDFNAAPRMGLALWARAIENRAPQRIGPWSAAPAIASTADPRPPVLNIEHEDVLLASMADASGLHHARLSWPAAPGAVGYFAYTTTEAKLRADRGLPAPGKHLTLAQRLAALRDAFAANPERRSFTRVNAEPVTGTAMQVSLPRGSKEIHLYLVIAVSAGNIESDWPTLADPALRRRPMAYAAPQVVQPLPPDLEVSRVLDAGVAPAAYRAAITLRSKPGPRVARIELHRVRVPEATLELDMMGPPLARISGSGGGYSVSAATMAADGFDQTIGRVTGRDAVPGSWKRVYYRAVAWAADDPTRGLYGARSLPSALREVLVPPATPPDLAPLAAAWPGGTNLLALVAESSTSAPAANTPLGPHRLRVDVVAEAADGSSSLLWSHPATAAAVDADRLDLLPTSPPAPGTTGLWRAAVAAGSTQLKLQFARPDASTQLKLRWLLTDPLGRVTERLMNIAAGLPLPAPDLLNFGTLKRPPRGLLASFTTSALFTDTSAGPYVLQLQWRAAAGPGPFGLAPAPVGLRVALPELAPLGAAEDLLADPQPLPARRSRNPANGITLALRGRFGGSLQITLLSPDGRSATLTRKLVA